MDKSFDSCVNWEWLPCNPSKQANLYQLVLGDSKFFSPRYKFGFGVLAKGAPSWINFKRKACWYCCSQRKPTNGHHRNGKSEGMWERMENKFSFPLVCYAWRSSDQEIKSGVCSKVFIRNQIHSPFNFSKTAFTMFSTEAIAPIPTSPQASFLLTGSITSTPNSFRREICLSVTGWNHMKVFIAGATRKGLLKFHARATLVWEKKKRILGKCNYDSNQ